MILVVRRHRPPRITRFIGLILATAALAALFWIGGLLFARFSAPPGLAKILPAAQTLAFFEVNLAHAAAGELLRPFAGTDPAQLLELDFPLPPGFWAGVDGQIGAAFLGEKFDPAKAVLFAQAADKKQMHALLAGAALPTEELKNAPATDALFAPKIYSLPQSSALFFAWHGDTVLLARSESTLKQAFSVGARVADTAEYAAVIHRVNPRALGFGYLAPGFAHELAAGSAAGLRRALVRPIADSFTATGFNLTATAAGLQLDFFTPLAPAVARTFTFENIANNKVADFTPLFGAEVTAFIAGHGADVFLQEFAKLTPAVGTTSLATATADQLTQQFLGAGSTFARDLAPFLAHDFAFGSTATGGYFALANPPNAANLLIQLQSSLAKGGWLAAAQARELPDGTRATERVANTAEKTVTQIAGANVAQLTAGDRQLFLADADGLLVLATKKAELGMLLARLNYPTASTLPAATAAATLPGSARFFAQLRSPQPLLAPFSSFWLAPRWLPGEGLAGTLFWGR